MKWTVIDTSGQRVTEKVFDNVFMPRLERLTVLDGKQWGLMNGKTGDWIIEPRYDEFRTFLTPVTAAKRDGNYGLVSDDGKEIGKWEFKLIWGFSDGLAPANCNGQYGYLRPDGTWSIEPNFSDAQEFSEGRAIVRTGGRLDGFIDTAGDHVTDCKFIVTRWFGDGLAFVRESGGKQGFIDKSGEFVLPGDWFQIASTFSEGLCRYNTHDDAPEPGVGFLDMHGQPVFDRVFDDVQKFRNGLAAVKIGKQWGAINTSGDLVIPAEYDRVGALNNGLVPAYKDGRCGYLTPNGETAIPFEFEQARSFTDDGFAVVKLV